MIACVASKPRPSGWLWVETQQGNSELGTYLSSSSELLAIGTSSPGSSDELQQDIVIRDRTSPRVMTTDVQLPSPAKSPETLPKTSSGTVESGVSSQRNARNEFTK